MDLDELYENELYNLDDEYYYINFSSQNYRIKYKILEGDGFYQKIIRKYWYNYKLKNYLRNIYRTSIFKNELIYLPNIGIKYFEGLNSWYKKFSKSKL